ncbi:hypothetical protein J41TS12_18550 [Paenibacillus antibioticophila]|uniref:ArpU family transcriptional regulator n=2 Tax=Paenibacillus antibioticophila TaxID=1274374 RepID=A0A919XQ84_9BACL|nr:hypothetical protein J41TS12_18550 [Paenibacillus antibioticophila]
MEQMSLGDDFLPELDARETKKAVIEAFDKYRKCKYLTFEEREASMTASYSDMPRGGGISDQTASIAVYNTDKNAARRAYCERIERAVARLPRMERFLIERRYMAADSDYITDQRVYNHEFQPEISWTLYKKYRWEAFYKLALYLRIHVVAKKNEDGEKDGDK